MLLAETVSIDGGTLLLILGVLLAVFAAWCFVVYLGFRFARQAGRGDQRALAYWVVAGVVEVGAVALSPFVVVALILLGLQVWQYSRARNDDAGADGR